MTTYVLGGAPGRRRVKNPKRVQTYGHTLLCLACGGEFASARKHAKTCSVACRMKSMRTRARMRKELKAAGLKLAPKKRGKLSKKRATRRAAKP